MIISAREWVMILRFSFFISCMASSLVLGRPLFTLKNVLNSYVSFCRRQKTRSLLARACCSDSEVAATSIANSDERWNCAHRGRKGCEKRFLNLTSALSHTGVGVDCGG